MGCVCAWAHYTYHEFGAGREPEQCAAAGDGMGATLARSAAIGQRAIAISAGPPLRRGALRGAHGNPGRARALA